MTDDTSAAVRDRDISDMNEIKQQNAELLARLAVVVRDKADLYAALKEADKQFRLNGYVEEVHPRAMIRAVLARIVIWPSPNPTRPMSVGCVSQC